MRLPLVTLVSVLLVFTAGCQKPTADIKVQAHTPSALTLWTSEMANKLPAMAAEISDAVVEERLSLTQKNPKTPSADIALKVCENLHGMRLQDLLVRTHTAKIERLKGERDQYQESYDALLNLRTRKGDTDSERYVATQREQTKTRLDKLNAGIKTSEQRLEALKAGAL